MIKKFIIVIIILIIIFCSLVIKVLYYVKTGGIFKGVQVQFLIIPERPVVSSEGEKILFSSLGYKSFGRRGCDIFIVDHLHGMINQVTTDGVSEFPTWRKRGKTIIFSSFKEGLPEITQIATDGSQFLPFCQW